MQVSIKKFDNKGVPLFFDKAAITGRSLLAENHTITKLKPAAQTRNRILLFIQQIFQRVLNWLFPLAKTNYAGIVAAFDRHEGVNILNHPQMLDYFHRFFKSDTPSSRNMTRCIEQLQEQHKAITEFAKAQAEKQKPTEKTPEKFGQLLAQWKQQVQSLKEGEQCLIAASPEEGNELFYLFSKKGGETTLKVIGRGKTMVRLSTVEEVAVAGQAKVVASLNYGKVDANFIKNLLDFSPLGEKRLEEPAFDTLLKGRLIPGDLSTNLKTKTKDVFWNILQQVDLNSGHTTGDFERSRLRLEIFTLFNMLQEHRFGVSANIIDVNTLQRMLQICSQNLVESLQDGLISPKEMEELAKELKLVQRAIDAAHQGTPASIKTLNMGSMDIYPIKGLPELVPTSTLTVQATASVSNPRFPNLAPPAALGRKAITRQPPQVKQAGSIPQTIQALVDDATPQLLVSGI